MIKIIALKEGFRRCGVVHSRRGTSFPDDHWSPEQLAILKSEPMLKVEDVVDPAAPVVTDPPAAAPVVADPPAAPVVTDPPAADPVVTDPPAADPVVTDPPAAAPVKNKVPAKPAAAAKPKGKK